MGYVRGEMTNLFNGVREPSIWFGLSGILYLLAARHHSASRFDG